MENLAVASRRATEATRKKNSGGAMEAAHEIGEIGEAHVIGDIGDRALILGQQTAARRSRERMKRYSCGVNAQNLGEEPQEMKRAEPDLRRRGLEADGILGMGIDPERGRHRAAAIRSSRRRRPLLASGSDLDETRRQQQPQLLETDIAAALGRGLGELAQHHELRHRCHRADAPERGLPADRFDPIGREVKGEALVAMDMVMGAEIFVAAMADQERAGDQLEGPAAAAVAEAPFSRKEREKLSCSSS